MITIRSEYDDYVDIVEAVLLMRMKPSPGKQQMRFSTIAIAAEGYHQPIRVPAQLSRPIVKRLYSKFNPQGHHTALPSAPHGWCRNRALFLFLMLEPT